MKLLIYRRPEHLHKTDSGTVDQRLYELTKYFQNKCAQKPNPLPNYYKLFIFILMMLPQKDIIARRKMQCCLKGIVFLLYISVLYYV